VFSLLKVAIYCQHFQKIKECCIFTALHGMQMWSGDENSLLSIRPSVCQNCDITEEKSVQIFITYEISFSLIFWEKQWLVQARPIWTLYVCLVCCH